MSTYDIERGRPYQGGGGNSGFAGSTRGGDFGGNYGGGGEDPLVTSLKENIRQISNNVTNLTKMVSNLGAPGRDSPELREKLNSTIETTKLIIRNATQQIRDLSGNVRGSPEERNQQKMVHQKLTKDFGVWLQKFQEISKISAQKERSTPLPAANTYNAPPTTNNRQTQPAWGKQANNQEQYHHQYEEDRDEKQGLLEASRRDNLMQIEGEREFNDAMIQDREEGIKQIEATITEVGGIFQDLAQIVHEQGFMIDNIESNVESTSHNTAEAVVELRKASKHQRSARTKMCWLMLIIAIVIGVIAVAIYFGVK